MVNLNPEEVGHSEGSVESMLGVLSGSDFKAFEDSPYEATSLRESLVHEVGQGPDVPKEPHLETF